MAWNSGEGKPPEPSFAHGMCRACYLEFLQVAGSCEDGAANPPAFTRGVQRELAAQQAEESHLPLVRREWYTVPLSSSA